MLHARVIRPGAVGAKLVSVDEASIKDIHGAPVGVVLQRKVLAPDRRVAGVVGQLDDAEGFPAKDGDLVKSRSSELERQASQTPPSPGGCRRYHAVD